MKIKKILMALAMSACLTLGATGIAACAHKDNDGSVDTRDPQIAAVYQLYVASAEQNGDTPMTYEEWYADLLANAKGEKGDKGDKGDRGERGEIGVGIPGPQGEKGDKGEDGEKGEKGDKGEQGEKGEDGATGKNGADGKDGKDGATWLVGSIDPRSFEGKDGDLYLNITTWDVWHKVSGEWTLLGNIKGADGVGGGSEDTQNVIMNFGGLTLAAGEQKYIVGTTDVPLSRIDNGYYYFVAETESTPADGTLTLIHNYKSAEKPCDMFMPLSNKYQCFFVKNDNTSSVYIKNDSDSELKIKSLKLVEYVAPTIEEGKEVEVFTNAPGVIDVPFDIDPSLAGKNVKITISNWVNTTTATTKYVTVVDGTNKKAVFTFAATNYNSGVFEMTGTIPEGITSLIFRDMTNVQGRNIVVKIEVVA